MKFLLDNNLSRHLAEGLRGFGEKDVMHLTDRFPDDTDDATLLKYMGEEHIFFITRDLRIRWKPAEIRALKDYNIGAFFLGGKNQSRCQLIQQLVRHWPKIKEHSLNYRNKRPFAFRVPPTGTKFTKISLQ